MSIEFKLPEQKDLVCKAACPYIRHGMNPCGQMGEDKNEPCVTEISNLIQQIDALRTDNPVGFVDAVATPPIPHILNIGLQMEHGEQPYGSIVSGTWYPTEQSGVV